MFEQNMVDCSSSEISSSWMIMFVIFISPPSVSRIYIKLAPKYSSYHMNGAIFLQGKKRSWRHVNHPQLKILNDANFSH